MKVCKQCEERKPFTDYYKHSSMSDGYLNNCKDCHKANMRRNREENVDRYREYDRQRGARRDANAARRYRENNPEKYKAHNAVNNAIRDGKLERKPCEVCGRTDVHGHHDDYSKPLDVIWLCPPCHFARHKVLSIPF